MSPVWPEGVTGLDHTADVGVAVRAPTLEDLFRRAAAAMVALVSGAEEGPATLDPSSIGPHAADSGSHRVELDAPDLEALLVAWLREILFLFQVRAYAYAGAHFDVLSDTRLVARIDGTAAEPVMELKGVTYHALAVGRIGDDWTARIVFDV